MPCPEVCRRVGGAPLLPLAGRGRYEAAPDYGHYPWIIQVEVSVDRWEARVMSHPLIVRLAVALPVSVKVELQAD